MERKRYRSIYKFLRIGEKEYAVLDHKVAAERAEEHFLHALSLLAGKVSDETQEEVNKALMLATDFGSKDAPFLIAQRIHDHVKGPFTNEEIAVFLKIAAERGHAEAAYQMACSYAGSQKYKAVENAASGYFNSFESEERGRLAEYYFKKAIENGHPDAVEELILAYAYGRGHIAQNANSFVTLCEEQVTQENQSVMVGYGAWLAGMTVEGEDPLSEAVKLPVNPSRALNYLLLAAKGNNLELGQHALHLICMGMLRGVWQRKQMDKFRDKLIQEAHGGHQLLALYLAWYSIPLVQRSSMPRVLENYQLSQLAEVVEQDESEALAFLDKAFFGKDEDISAVAKEILSHVFGRCFLNEQGLLQIEEVAVGDTRL